MKILSLLIIIYSLYSILCPGVKAQWDGAQVQRLTYNTSQNGLTGFYIDKDDKLFLVYHQWWWDPYNQPYRDTLFLMTRVKDGEWSQPERISKDPYEMVSGQESCGKYVGFDPYSGVMHIFYDCSNETLYYTNSNMPNWEVVKTDSGPYRARPQAMKFDTLGNIHLVWNIKFDSLSQNWYRVMYANNSTGEWIKQQVSPPIWLGSYNPGYNPVFDVQKNGTIHIMYQGEPYCDTECVAFYARNDSLNSTHWDIDTVPKPSRLLWSYWAGPVKIDDNNVIHLLTGGCVAEDCVWPGLKRTFYYYKPVDDSIWQGPELIPDSLFTIFILSLFIDKDGIPNLIEKEPSTYHLFFTNRKQAVWEQPNEFFDDTLYYTNYQFVMDTQGKGHGAYETYGLSGYSDALWYYGPPFSAVQDTSITYRKQNFQLFQNYPNPFNSSTIITYETTKEEVIILNIYDILGRKVCNLVSNIQKTGNHLLIWDGINSQGKEVASGIYFYQLKAGNLKETKRLLFIK